MALVTGTFMNLLPAAAQNRVNTSAETIEASAITWGNSSSKSNIVSAPMSNDAIVISQAANRAPMATTKATVAPSKKQAVTPANSGGLNNNPQIAQNTQTNTQNTRINGSGQTRTQTNVQTTTPSNTNVPSTNPRTTPSSATTTATPKPPVSVKQEDLIPRVPYALRQPKYNPSLSAGIPSGFGMRTGDSFIGLFGATAGKLRDSIDGSMAVGTGIGDPDKFVALEGVFNMTSIRRFGSNGTFDLKLHRTLYQGANGQQLSAAVGWNAFAAYGSDAGGQPSSVYGALSWNQALDPKNSDNPMLLSITGGMGGGSYRNDTNGTGPGVFGGVGLQVSPNVGISTGWAGQGLNFAVSYLPIKTTPLYLTAIYSDVSNASRTGSQFILGITYGFNYLPASR